MFRSLCRLFVEAFWILASFFLACLHGLLVFLFGMVCWVTMLLCLHLVGDYLG